MACENKTQYQKSQFKILGANSGIGFATAKDLYRRGAEVVMLCRNLPKAEQAADKVTIQWNLTTC